MSAEDRIRILLSTYERALNAGDAALAAACYTTDGVFMPLGQPTAAGPALYDAFSRTFEKIRLAVTFTVDELVVASDDTAYALARSNCIQTLLATGAESTASNRDVFIFGYEQAVWKIARYLFNTAH
jgi:uncharacterized protein (TIGR02246 family)